MSSLAHSPAPEVDRTRPITAFGVGRVLEHLYARTPAKFRSALVLGLVSPAFFLGLLGFGLGSLINDRQGAGAGSAALGGNSYIQFIGPGLLAISAVLWAFGQSLWPTAGAFRWDRTYVLTAATPVTKAEIALAHVAWIVLRFVVAAALYTTVLVAVGAATSAWAVLCPLAAGLTVSAIASWACAYTVRQESEDTFPLLMRLGAVPMFLFSGAFFPLSEMPATVAWLARLTPGWHGVELCRDLATGGLGPMSLAHLAYLVTVTVAGLIPLVTGFEKVLSDL